MSDAIILTPIGRVHPADSPQQKIIEIAPEFADALLGVDKLEHLLVLYWMHELPAGRRSVLQGHPRGDRSRPLRGVFALHSPMRPNPIGVTRVRLVQRRDNRLYVEDLDAVPGSPVIDIKSG
jgi:tRNA-Thr(GGU) m(6)t(6)A37 methyltransferase TsaA